MASCGSSTLNHGRDATPVSPCSITSRHGKEAYLSVTGGAPGLCPSDRPIALRLFSICKLPKGCRMELRMCARVVPVPLVKKRSSTVGVHSSHVDVLVPVRRLAPSSQAAPLIQPNSMAQIRNLPATSFGKGNCSAPSQLHSSRAPIRFQFNAPPSPCPQETTAGEKERSGKLHATAYRL
jgi:hypothetical protein